MKPLSHGLQVYLIGTAHFSKESCEDVATVIQVFDSKNLAMAQSISIRMPAIKSAISHFERHKKVKDLWTLDMREELDPNKTQLLHRKQLCFCSGQAAFGCYRAVQHSACTCYQSTNSFKCPNHLLVNSRFV